MTKRVGSGNEMCSQLRENKMLKQITQSPYLNLFSGLILLTTSAYETIVTLDEVHFGVSHGILIFSIIQIIKVMPEIMHGLTEIQEADDLAEERRTS
ncbi:MAG: hypothetical protein PVG66_06080 [Chromatiales bacterium]